MTEAMTDDKLLPCPFCGCDDIGTESTATDGSVWCNGCRARITCRHYQRLDIGQRDAIAAWNRRPELERRAVPAGAGDWPLLVDGEKSWRIPPDEFSTLMAHGILGSRADGTYRLCDSEELEGDPGSAGVNNPKPLAVLAVVRAALAARSRDTEPGEPVAWQYRYWYSSGEPGVWLNERRADADDMLSSGILIREDKRALYTLISELRTALAEAEYRPGDHPVVPVRIAAFMDKARAMIAARPKESDK